MSSAALRVVIVGGGMLKRVRQKLTVDRGRDRQVVLATYDADSNQSRHGRRLGRGCVKVKNRSASVGTGLVLLLLQTEHGSLRPEF
jgi:hypothetical protein